MGKIISFVRQNIAVSVLALLLVVSVGVGAYFYQKAAADPQKIAQNELQETISAVGKLIVLPTDETPTMATVSDPAKLSSQPFFAHAKVGDKVLVYTKAGKAILYNPSSNKIVEVAPVNTGSGLNAP